MTNLEDILNMAYVDFMAFIKETNRAPGWEKMLIEMAKNTFMTNTKKAIHIACNTGSALRELNRLTGCSGLWIDINENMIKTANQLRDKEWINSSLLNYEVMDWEKLTISDQEFDISFTTWGMAFVPNKSKAIAEMVRITKDWWFIADIIMYYKQMPPEYLINEMNALMKINIQKRDKEFWINLYQEQGLSLFYEYDWSYADVNHQKLLEYCRIMAENRNELNKEQKKIIEYKLFWIMSLFTENHKYLWAKLLIFRKKTINEQISLFT